TSDMKSFTDLFIKRPVLALVVSFVILIAGLQAMKTINVRQYPRSDIAAITVSTVYVGADAELVRGFITTPLERAIAASDGIDYLMCLVAPRQTAFDGVQKADVLGSRTFAMRIWMKPDRMAALNISPAQVRNMLARNNFLSAVGNTKGSLLQVNLTANTDLHTVDDFKKLVIRQEKGNLVRLSDIADVELGAEDYNTEVRFSGQKAVFM